MSYTITYNGVEGQTNLTAQIVRKLDNMAWTADGWVQYGRIFVDGAWHQWTDNSDNIWVDGATPDSLAMVEDELIPGKYTCTVEELNPSDGGIYIVSIYQDSALLFEMDCMYQSKQNTILSIINNVQTWLRLPKSTLITDAHAALLLGFANEVQSDYVSDFCEWEESKLRACFDIVPGQSVYSLCPLQGIALDGIVELRIGDYPPLAKPSRDEFRKSLGEFNPYNRPTAYNIYAKAGKALMIEVSPIPDAIYRVTANLVMKPSELVNATDIPLMDQDVIALGMKYLCRKDQGEDFTAELATFQAKLSLYAGAHGESEDRGLDFL